MVLLCCQIKLTPENDSYVYFDRANEKTQKVVEASGQYCNQWRNDRNPRYEFLFHLSNVNIEARSKATNDAFREFYHHSSSGPRYV